MYIMRRTELSTFNRHCLEAVGRDGDLCETDWSSSDPSIATVEMGVVTFKKPGTVTITARSGDFTETTELTGAKRALYNSLLYDYSEEKGVRTLVEVAQQLPQIPFIFAGSGPLESLLAQASNINNVGFQTGEALYTLIRRARFAVYPSEWYENCPLAVMESQMLGTPVLGANIGGIPELVRDGQTGELFESGNAEELKKKVLDLWTDREKAMSYAENCDHVEFMSAGEYMERLMCHYR
jgi:glycosyltransferase involved in cell wall biosynthesis